MSADILPAAYCGKDKMCSSSPGEIQRNKNSQNPWLLQHPHIS